MSKAVTLTIKPEVLKKGREDAKKQNRSLSNYIEWLILNNPKQK